MKKFEEFRDSFELAKGCSSAVVLDQNLRALKTALEHEGYKVVMPQTGASDAEIKELASRGWTILTANSRDFVDDAARFDYDVISVEDIKFIDTKSDSGNQTVAKIAGAMRRSQLATRKGNFLLTIHDDGSFHLRQLV